MAPIRALKRSRRYEQRGLSWTVLVGLAILEAQHGGAMDPDKEIAMATIMDRQRWAQQEWRRWARFADGEIRRGRMSPWPEWTYWLSVVAGLIFRCAGVKEFPA